jgi:dolichol-phosphate mannosyltransferase
MSELQVALAPKAHASASPHGAPELAIIIPTLNERDNVAPLVELIDQALPGIAWEAIFVDDDSTDGTRDAVFALAARDARVRCLQRIGRRGLASACIEGALASSASFIAVIDADLQHDERLLAQMLAILKQEPVDIVVGSRHVAGGGFGAMEERRQRISNFATGLSRIILRADVSDPMSGFFMMRRSAFDRSVRRLSGIGFKILIDLFASSPEPLRYRELPYEFRARRHGESKLDALVVWEYLMLMGDKLVGHVVPIRFLSFAVVGAIGVLVQLAALTLLRSGFGMDFKSAQALAIVVAMIGNFLLNNVLTYRDLRLRGWRWLGGLMSFCLVCSAGAVANWGAATLLFEQLALPSWLASTAGALVGAVWNYAMSGVTTWRKRVKA